MQDSNLRPLGYEPSELPLLQPAICAAYLHRQTALPHGQFKLCINKHINKQVINKRFMQKHLELWRYYRTRTNISRR